jgi:hypothetical protein
MNSARPLSRLPQILAPARNGFFGASDNLMSIVQKQPSMAWPISLLSHLPKRLGTTPPTAHRPDDKKSIPPEQTARKHALDRI